MRRGRDSHSAAGHGGIEPRLPDRPAMAFVAVIGLLRGRLAILRIDEQLVAGRRLSGGGLIEAVRRRYHLVLIAVEHDGKILLMLDVEKERGGELEKLVKHEVPEIEFAGFEPHAPIVP